MVSLSQCNVRLYHKLGRIFLHLPALYKKVLWSMKITRYSTDCNKSSNTINKTTIFTVYDNEALRRIYGPTKAEAA
jgi:hypothetical protein